MPEVGDAVEGQQNDKLQPDVEENNKCPLVCAVKQLKIYINHTGPLQCFYK